ncbi:MAG: acetyl-CoA carboxylase biotin carboxyl carrier protein [Nitrospinota bacterium]
MEIDDIKKLIELVDKSDLLELEIEEGGKKISLRKGDGAVGASPVETPRSAPIGKPAVKQEQRPAKAEHPAAIPEGDQYHKVESPMVGTFYRASAEGAAPYVKEGDQVKKGQVLCIVEAMKLMNEIESEVSGKLISILGQNAKPVEFGEPLFVIEKDA